MTKKELEDVIKVLNRIKNPDANVLKAIAIVNKNIEEYKGRKDQLKNSYEVEFPY